MKTDKISKSRIAILVIAIVTMTATLALLATPTVGTGKVYAASASTKVPFLCRDESGQQVPCLFTPEGPGCENAEDILLTGTLNVVRTTANGDTVVLQFHPQGITGVGQTTGTTYRGTGGTIYIAYPPKDGESHTVINNFNIIATKPAGISSIEHSVVHLTINAQGVVTADVEPTPHSSCR